MEPKDFRIDTKNTCVGRIIHNISDGTIYIAGAVPAWDDVKQSCYIESMLLRIPIPPFSFLLKEGENESWLPIDGWKRLITIQRFVSGELRLQGLEFFTEYEGKTHKELPRFMQRRIYETQVFANMISNASTSYDALQSIIRRLSGG